MENVIDVKLITGAARTVRQLLTSPKYGLDYYRREYNWSESNVTEMVDDLTRTFYGVSLADLVGARLLTDGETLNGARLGTKYTATLLPLGKIRIESGREFGTLSGTADYLTGKSNHG